MYTKEQAKRMFDKGFYKLIDKLYTKIKPEQIFSMKSKYGRMDLYVEGTDDEQDFAYEIERESERTCETCGKPGDLMEKNGWIIASCKKCFNK